MMRLMPQLVPDWPKLAWVAHFAEGSDEIGVLHGPMVETADDWVVEAVWDGDFAAGDFDRTDLVFGTGIRIREGDVFFVSSGTTLDRLWHCRKDGKTFVSNSLPAVLGTTGLSLQDDYTEYSRDFYTIQRGLDWYCREFRTIQEPTSCTAFHNCVYRGCHLEDASKPDKAPSFESYEDYRRFLVMTAERIGANLTSPRRTCCVTPLATISSGYDSSAAAAVAKWAGCARAVTIRRSSSLWRGSDSGEPVARALGLSCQSYPRSAPSYPFEGTFWACTGRPADINISLFDYPEPLACLFTGYHGDKVWGIEAQDHADPFAGAGYSGRGFAEFRLHRGFFHCCVPFWGYRRAHQIQAISRREEMRPWTLQRKYDRPIPRRILEELGVPRGAFGMRKKNTSLEVRFRWPYSTEARESFAAYLADRGMGAPSPVKLWLMRRSDRAYTLFHLNAPSVIRTRWRRKLWAGVTAQSLLFQWANHALKTRYCEALVAANLEASTELRTCTPATSARMEGPRS